MAVNKVVKSDGTTLIDLSQDTVTSASHILRGHTGHLADGSQVSGAADYSVTYSMSGGAYATSTPARVISGEGFTSRIKVPNGYILQNITVTMGGIDITNSAVEYEEIVDDLITHAITYNFSNGISSNISPSEILDNEGLFLKLSAPSGYNLSGVSVTMDGVDITSQVFAYGEDSGGGGITPTGTKTISITENGTTTEDVTAYANAQISVNVPSNSPSLQSKSVSYTPSETAQSVTVTADNGYDGLSSVAVSVEAVSNAYVGTGVTRQAAKTVTPSESFQTAVASGVYTTGAVTVGAISSTYVGTGISRNDSSDLTASGATVSVPAGYYASSASKSVTAGTAGTPTATKGTVSNHSISVTPSVTNTAGYISGGTKTGTAVTVSASELVSGSETKTANGTYDVTNLASLVVNVPTGSTKNVQYYMGADSVAAGSYTATDVTLTVSKTGTYKVSWMGWRSTSSGTSGSQLYINGTAYGSANATFTGTYGQAITLTGVSLTQGDVLVVRARSRNTSYYMYVGNLIIEEQ